MSSPVRNVSYCYCTGLHYVCKLRHSNIKLIVLHFKEIHIFALVWRVKQEDRHHCHVCALNVKLEAGGY